MRVLLLLLVLGTALPLAAPPAAACHPEPDTPPHGPVAVWFDHGCGSGPTTCVRVGSEVRCLGLP